jgi:hypothetical protein
MAEPPPENGAEAGALGDSSKENIATKRKHDELSENDTTKVLIIPDLFEKLMSRAYALNPHYESVRDESLEWASKYVSAAGQIYHANRLGYADMMPRKKSVCVVETSHSLVLSRFLMLPLRS